MIFYVAINRFMARLYHAEVARRIRANARVNAYF